MLRLAVAALALCLVAVAVRAGPPTPPIFPEHFSVPITSLAEVNGVNETAYGMMFYSYTSSVKGWLWTEDNLKNPNSLCAAAASSMGITNTNTTCGNYMIEAGTYIVFPEFKKCCQACTGEQGCGPVIPTWFKNGTLDGIQEIDGELCHRWFLQGNQANYFWIKVTARDFSDAIAYGTAPPLEAVIFDHRHFHFGPLPASLFALPAECTNAPSCGNF